MGCARAMRKRLRPKYSDEQLKEIYAVPHDHRKWVDHRVRVESTIALASGYFEGKDIFSIADLSTGDAEIPLGIRGNVTTIENSYLGDFAPKYEHIGPIDKTINDISSVDLYILSETLEHLDDPDNTLKLISDKAKYIVLTTPVVENIANPEHYWKWGKEDVKKMLLDVGFEPVVYSELRFCYLNDYGYQLWIAKNTKEI